MAVVVERSLVSQAVTAVEASAILGVCRGVSNSMAKRGEVSCKEFSSLDDPERIYRFFDAAECDRNFRDYAESSKAGGRPRAHVDDRQAVIEFLSRQSVQIDFDDAISPSEAAGLLGWSRGYVTRLVREGKLVGRGVWSGTYEHPVMVIVSRQSCLEMADQVEWDAA